MCIVIELQFVDYPVSQVPEIARFIDRLPKLHLPSYESGKRKRRSKEKKRISKISGIRKNDPSQGKESEAIEVVLLFFVHGRSCAVHQ